MYSWGRWPIPASTGVVAVWYVFLGPLAHSCLRWVVAVWYIFLGPLAHPCLRWVVAVWYVFLGPLAHSCLRWVVAVWCVFLGPLAHSCLRWGCGRLVCIPGAICKCQCTWKRRFTLWEMGINYCLPINSVVFAEVIDCIGAWLADSCLHWVVAVWYVFLGPLPHSCLHWVVAVWYVFLGPFVNVHTSTYLEKEVHSVGDGHKLLPPDRFRGVCGGD